MDKKKLRYAILKEIDSKNFPLTEYMFGVDEEVFDNNIRFLHREKYIINVQYSDDRPEMDNQYIELTEKGEQFLEDNSAWAKVYKGLKEIKSWIF
ncbi:YjcQ protein [Clostridium baratii]|uniref:YjcQ family protein n=1 Tax=Clostridium baratii TaxID=1561 RepID=UPI0006C6A7AC|nr:YjcQ family protein [Clostridium baratii]CUP06186.1 YjcQ protein [Clostridium baratii]